MKSLTELYRIGIGPSSSHTMGPMCAAEIFKNRHKYDDNFKVTLYGSLAATGKGHLTDSAIRKAFAPKDVEISWKPDEYLPHHPNGMLFQAVSDKGEQDQWTVYSIGGGALWYGDDKEKVSIYPLSSMADIVAWAHDAGKPIWKYVEECEGANIWDFLSTVWNVMKDSVSRGISTEGVLPGSLKLQRKSSSYFSKAKLCDKEVRRKGLLFAYALGVAEENASGGKVVTAPTCGSCGVLPSILTYIQKNHGCGEKDILHALATAGLVGNLVKENASISGAEVGCQGEIGTACAMAAAAAAQLFGGTAGQIEYAAEIGMEHHLGLTCDPVDGLVQIPCIERNAFAATRAFDCAAFAILSDGAHRISFDDVVATMKQTGYDLQSRYRETSAGGLAEIYRKKHV